MSTTQETSFTTLPNDILIDLVSSTPTSSIINFYLVNKAHLELFDTGHGLWEQLARRIFHWSANALPSFKASNMIDWKKEFRVASYFQSALTNGRMRLNSSRKQVIEYITDNHVKFKGAAEAPIKEMDCCLQHTTKLYPLPIGNFTTAYYEVELLSDSIVAHNLVVGGALDGYTGYVGASILSYGYCRDGSIYLECDTTPIEEPEFFIHKGDTMGFGINFAKQSVFFTKNGKLIYEANKNLKNEPLLELKHLHATMTIHKHELVVNRGSSPFMFDLLKYQCEHGNKPLELYSNVVVRHLVSQYDLNESVIEKRYLSTGAVPTTGNLFCENNVPNFPVKMPEMFYFLLYGRLPPGSKTTLDEEDVQDMNMFEMSRGILNSGPVMFMDQMLKKQTTHAKDLVELWTQWAQLDHIRSMPWEDQCDHVLSTAQQVLFQASTRFPMKPRYAEEIASYYFQDSPLGCFSFLLAAVELFYTDRPVNEAGALYWSKEIALSVLHHNNGGQGLDGIGSRFIEDLFNIRANVALTSVLAQRCGDLAKKKEKEYEQIKFVFGGDKDQSLRGAYNTLLERLHKLSFDDPLNDTLHDTKLISNISVIIRQSNAIKFLKKKGEEDVSDLLFYGIYKLKLSPTDFATAEEFVHEVLKQTTKLISDDAKQEFLQFMLNAINSDLTEEDLVDGRSFEPLRYVFGMKINRKQGSSIKEYQQYLDQQVRHMLETKNYGKMWRVKSTKRAQPNINTSLMVIGIGAVVAVSVIGAFLLRKRFSK